MSQEVFYDRGGEKRTFDVVLHEIARVINDGTMEKYEMRLNQR